MKILLLTLALVASSVCSAESDQALTIAMGVGTDSCGTFIKAIDAMAITGSAKRAALEWQGKSWVELGFAYEQWLLGFVNGSNFARLDASKQIAVDRDGIVLSVKRICEDHPDELLVSAANRFVVAQQHKMK